MGRVSMPLRKGADMIMPDGSVYRMDGPEGVADAIRASMDFQIEFMKDALQMRTQNDTFRERIKVMQSRSDVGDEKTTIKISGGEGKDIGKGKRDKEKERKEDRRREGAAKEG
jgi:hypothetical protein